MAYIGNIPAGAYISISSQTFTTINGTDYTLSSSVESSEDIALFLNNVRQKPSTYTATATTLTMGTATTTADELYCVFLGKALQTVNPGAGSVGTAQIADDAVTYAKIQDTTTANRVIGAATAGEVSEVQVATDMVADEAITTPKANFISTSSGAGVISKGTASDSDGYIALNCDQNTHAIKLKSPPHSAAQTYTLTFPITAPATDTYLKAASGGQLSFATVTEYNDDALQNDIATLALHQATNANASKYNLVNTNVDQYEDDTGIASTTDTSRNNTSEYVSTAVETYDANTVLLLHFDDAGCTDSSGNGITTTLESGAARSGVSYKFGSYSILLNGSSDYLRTADITAGSPAVAAPTTGDFTVDFWFKYNSTSINTGRFFDLDANGLPTSTVGIGGMVAGYNTSSQMNVAGEDATGTNWNISYPGIDSTTWHHFANMRSGTTVYNFLDGVRKGDTTAWDGIDMTQNDKTILIGAPSHTAGEYFNGYIDEFRYSNNARYSTSGTTGDTIFTPPTSAYAGATTTVNATGNYVSTATTANASVSKVGIVMIYKNAYGTNTLNTDIIAEVSADGGSNYSTATLTAAGTFSTGILQAVSNDISVTAGTSIQYRISFANQSESVKEARIYGVSLIY